jgi:tartrate dehydratase alpha subunit/fumarate hydratase class I-like protein
MLAVPGPDVLAHGVGHTFDEALKKLKAAALKALENRARKSRQLNGAVRGVKASHRG